MNNRRKLKVGVIGTVGIPAKYGGFETLVEHLILQKNKEFNFIVFCSSEAYEEKRKTYNGAELKYLPLKANGIQSIFYDIWSIFKSIKKVDALLVLGVSGCIVLPFIKKISKKKIIVNIDGLEWKRDKWGKKAKQFLKFSEKVAVKYSDVIIADNKVIQYHVMASYGKEAALIPYGADHTRTEALTSEVLEEFPFLDNPYAFKVCRIEPENNIELILGAFLKYQKLPLVLVGNWKVSNYSQKLRKDYSSFENLFLIDPIYDQKKLNQLRSNCYIYVHGHSAGGTNPSLVEAMYLKLPVLAFGVNYNRETTNHQANYFDDENSLINCLQELKRDKLQQNATAMKKIAVDNYTWKKVADQYAALLY